MSWIDCDRFFKAVLAAYYKPKMRKMQTKVPEWERVGDVIQETGLAVRNRLAVEVRHMLATVWLMLSALFYSLQLSAGSFPKPLSLEEERYYLELAAKGDLAARNILIERNLRLVAHIMNKS